MLKRISYPPDSNTSKKETRPSEIRLVWTTRPHQRELEVINLPGTLGATDGLFLYCDGLGAAKMQHLEKHALMVPGDDCGILLAESDRAGQKNLLLAATADEAKAIAFLKRDNMLDSQLHSLSS